MGHKHSELEDKAKVAGIAGLAALVGAGIAVLFSPRNGKQVRAGLKRRAKTVEQKIEHAVVLDTGDELPPETPPRRAVTTKPKRTAATRSTATKTAPKTIRKTPPKAK